MNRVGVNYEHSTIITSKYEKYTLAEYTSVGPALQEIPTTCTIMQLCQKFARVYRAYSLVRPSMPSSKKGLASPHKLFIFRLKRKTIVHNLSYYMPYKIYDLKFKNFIVTNLKLFSQFRKIIFIVNKKYDNKYSEHVFKCIYFNTL